MSLGVCKSKFINFGSRAENAKNGSWCPGLLYTLSKKINATIAATGCLVINQRMAVVINQNN